MNLKTATRLVYLSLIVELVLSICQWVLFDFDLISYGSFGRGFSTILGFLHLILAIPMVLFFGALNAKQKNNASDRSAEDSAGIKP